MLRPNRVQPLNANCFRIENNGPTQHNLSRSLQVVVHSGELREKPESPEEARRFIRSYGDSPASTIGACVCTCLETGTTVEDLDICRVHMDPVPEDVINSLIEEGGVFATAGGLMVEHPLVQPHVTRIEGVHAPHHQPDLMWPRLMQFTVVATHRL